MDLSRFQKFRRKRPVDAFHAQIGAVLSHLRQRLCGCSIDGHSAAEAGKKILVFHKLAVPF